MIKTGRQAKAADFAARVAEAAKKRHSERVETRTELPDELAQVIQDLSIQVLYLHKELMQIKTDLGDFYSKLGDKAA